MNLMTRPLSIIALRSSFASPPEFLSRSTSMKSRWAEVWIFFWRETVTLCTCSGMRLHPAPLALLSAWAPLPFVRNSMNLPRFLAVALASHCSIALVRVFLVFHRLRNGHIGQIEARYIVPLIARKNEACRPVVAIAACSVFTLEQVVTHTKYQKLTAAEVEVVLRYQAMSFTQFPWALIPHEGKPGVFKFVWYTSSVRQLRYISFVCLNNGYFFEDKVCAELAHIRTFVLLQMRRDGARQWEVSAFFFAFFRGVARLLAHACLQISQAKRASLECFGQTQ
jgi:hypothetical protein